MPPIVTFVPTKLAPDHTAVSPTDFREAMSRVAGAVNIVATGGHAGQGGLTATAVTSVSDAPPSLLVCLNATSRTAKMLIENGMFSVNTLAAEHVEIARHFSRSGISMEERFALGRWEAGAVGVPILAGALATFALRVVDLKRVGGHHIVVGEVLSAHAGTDAEPLVYHRRDYRVLRDQEHG
jgi:flavin reductase (DIM6/NTAB) family NADH-FMN oxidoreductase RutF